MTIFGSGSIRADEPAYAVAGEFGAEFARRGWTVCNGGYGGTMEASARGAREQGGHTIGVTCAALGRSGPNPFIQEERKTATLLDRLGMLVELGQAHVVLPGGAGTLLELAYVMDLRNKRLAHPAPFVAIGADWRPVVECIQAGSAGPRFVRDVREALAYLASTVAP